ncbi:MAG TPA: sugar phosphate isomerase/epimerase family protein [Bryobacteraceae bacterium]|nr:sugar phosphate isomerase/epimerase family protein [Bryobacteraceae bacterium]
MNRREFNRFGAAAAFGLAAKLGMAETFDYPWKLGVITDEVSPDLTVVLTQFFPKYGLKWAEIRNLKIDGKSKYAYKAATPVQLKEFRKQLDDAGVKLSVLDTDVYKVPLPGTTPIHEAGGELNPSEGGFQIQMDNLKKAAEAAHILGTNKLRIFTFGRVENPDTVFDRIVEQVNKALPIAKANDVILLVENEQSCNTVTGEEINKLLTAIPDRTLMLNWDPGNCAMAGEQPFPKAWDQFDHSRIGHMHLKDEADHKWRPVGGGDIDFKDQFEALKKMHYSNTLSLETHYRNAQRDAYTSSVESMDGIMKVLKQV